MATSTWVALVLGTRPEIIKLAPVSKALETAGVEHKLIHSGQHYDDKMSSNLFGIFGLKPDYSFAFGDRSRGSQVGKMVEHFSQMFTSERPRVVVVQGDTNTALAGAIAANCCGIPLVHVEAGLRSYDRSMPEEHNRVMIDHIADLLCAPTLHSEQLLNNESVLGKITITGNTELDAIEYLTPDDATCKQIVLDYDLTPNRFGVATIHRPENTDQVSQLSNVVEALNGSQVPILWAMHPRTVKALAQHNLTEQIDRAVVKVVDPLPVQNMFALLKSCAIAISDSGGIQEDVTAFGTPLVSIRKSTERPEGLNTFTKLVAADDPELRSTIVESTMSYPEWKLQLREVPSP